MSISEAKIVYLFLKIHALASCLIFSKVLASKFLNFSKAKFLRDHGAIFLARSAPSIAMVPDQQKGSIKGLLNFRLASRSRATARFSFMGASHACVL